MSRFDSTKIALPQILHDISTGKIQLPDFQRGWVWDDSLILSLLVSIARSFPVGVVMLLENGGEARFQTRPVENVAFSGATPMPEQLILDGQQRLTTLTQIMKHSGPVETSDENGDDIQRYYYIDINRMIGGHAPSRYLNGLQKHKQVGLDDAAMDVLLISHCVDPAALRADDFETFFEARGRALCGIIGEAMGKTIDVSTFKFLKA